MANAILLGPAGSSAHELPFFSSRIPAGFPSPAQDHLEAQLSLDELLNVRAPHTYLVRASGDSMTGVGIYDGDLLVVDRALPAYSGAVVIAALAGEVFVKRLQQDARGICLHSANPHYPPRQINAEDELQIWGVVRHSIHRHGQHD
ncbi:DNA polymerase V [Pseudomonas fluvialis]|uniref:DNA polymerase V n=1 Tax=Pseudomonas fluvialis TaxID=1793966 RepID=A0A7X0BSG3_9PSED|nr:translesion error-prone DNA polymerase V autoproteolytic subunit [Pseudomonas fluvialis]MBB6342039.1 DNA polymerase V [Pseudomonas fluvialis]